MVNPIVKFVSDLVRFRDEESTDPDVLPSDYWRDFCGYFRYLYSLEEEELLFIRRHTYHLTSDLYQPYYFASPQYRDLLIRGHRFFLDKLDGFHIDEGQFGIGVEGPTGRVSHDLLRYLGALVDLVKSKALFRSEAPVILELGGGYGGLGRMVMTFNPRTCYILCDLEETLFFSGTFLTQEFGKERVHLVENPLTGEELVEGHFYLVGQARLEDIKGLYFDLAVNQQSMQEMTQSQVMRYCAFLEEHADLFYTCNIDSHGQLARDKNIVTELDRLIADRFGRRIWKSKPPNTKNRFGDNILRRYVYKCR